ncbi:hypothetical protein [Hyphomonas sp.]|uniref:hypothetical protein n=1 Tax=Hyphomonas sp. TaxID=87 RepID=UPI0025C44F47|nr:hypothetical protein [Hyphomonas sp.]
MLPHIAIASARRPAEEARRHSTRKSFGVLSILLGLALPAGADTGSFANIEQISDILERARQAESQRNNTLEVTQSGRNLVVDAYVQGQMNRANTISQTGDNAAATVSVTGDANNFSIRQHSSPVGGQPAGRNDATLTIEGDSNDALIQQTNDFGELYYNSASLTQQGYGNTAAIYQTVSPGDLMEGGNVASIAQTGNDNDALIEQTGAGNTASIEQDGNNNQGRIYQDGEGLSALLVQTGDALEYTINQTGCVVASGCGTITVTQGAY